MTEIFFIFTDLGKYISRVSTKDFRKKETQINNLRYFCMMVVNMSTTMLLKKLTEWKAQGKWLISVHSF